MDKYILETHCGDRVGVVETVQEAAEMQGQASRAMSIRYTVGRDWDIWRRVRGMHEVRGPASWDRYIGSVGERTYAGKMKEMLGMLLVIA